MKGSRRQATTVGEDATDPVGAARAEVLAARDALDQWQTRHDDAQRDLDELDRAAGHIILEEPSKADHVEGRFLALRSTIRAAERALDAQRSRVTVAESRYLAAEADALEAQAVDARDVLERHEAVTKGLLEQLASHEGVFVPEGDFIAARRQAGYAATVWVLPKSHALIAEVSRLEDQVTVLREMAAGRDPREWEQSRPNYVNTGGVEYPACVTGPDALVKTQGYLDAIAGLRRTIAELADLARTLPGEIEEWRERVHLGAASYPQSGLARREARLEAVTAELGQARAQVQALMGDGETVGD